MTGKKNFVDIFYWYRKLMDCQHDVNTKDSNCCPQIHILYSRRILNLIELEDRGL